jgi:hypothetical protein
VEKEIEPYLDLSKDSCNFINKNGNKCCNKLTGLFGYTTLKPKYIWFCPKHTDILNMWKNTEEEVFSVFLHLPWKSSFVTIPKEIHTTKGQSIWKQMFEKKEIKEE